jgi:preprotein translocase subunit SecD
LRLGKPPRAAIDAGYSKAFVTILDSNVTTLIAALFLFAFGTGPVKGFALTLSIGIVVSMFTAVFVTRIIFDYFIWNRSISKISI